MPHPLWRDRKSLSEMNIQLIDFVQDGAFRWRWPSGNIEQFQRSWLGRAGIDGAIIEFRYALGRRHVYGRSRVHSVTWFANAPMVEGVETDDYVISRSLLSILRRPDKRHVREDADVPESYNGFLIVECRSEISAPYSPQALGVKIVDDNIAQWVTHAAIRAASFNRLPKQPRRRRPQLTTIVPRRPPGVPHRVVKSLLEYGRRSIPPSSDARFEPTPNPQANALVMQNPLAFLFAVIADQGVPAERAWQAPHELSRRLGYLDPCRIASSPDAVRAAVKGPPALHRFPQKYSRWLVAAARRVIEEYGSDAGQIWSGGFTAREVFERLNAFEGIGQKKAAMAVEILERDLKVPINEMQGSDVAYDIHVRRVFLRTGLAQRDELDHIVSVARELYPDRPGALDQPAWLIGRQWCKAGTPECITCPLTSVCPKIVYRIVDSPSA